MNPTGPGSIGPQHNQTPLDADNTTNKSATSDNGRVSIHEPNASIQQPNKEKPPIPPKPTLAERRTRKLPTGADQSVLQLKMKYNGGPPVTPETKQPQSIKASQPADQAKTNEKTQARTPLPTPTRSPETQPTSRDDTDKQFDDLAQRRAAASSTTQSSAEPVSLSQQNSINTEQGIDEDAEFDNFVQSRTESNEKVEPPAPQPVKKSPPKPPTRADSTRLSTTDELATLNDSKTARSTPKRRALSESMIQKMAALQGSSLSSGLPEAARSTHTSSAPVPAAPKDNSQTEQSVPAPAPAPAPASTTVRSTPKPARPAPPPPPRKAQVPTQSANQTIGLNKKSSTAQAPVIKQTQMTAPKHSQVSTQLQNAVITASTSTALISPAINVKNKTVKKMAQETVKKLEKNAQAMQNTLRKLDKARNESQRVKLEKLGIKQMQEMSKIKQQFTAAFPQIFTPAATLPAEDIILDAQETLTNLQSQLAIMQTNLLIKTKLSRKEQKQLKSLEALLQSDKMRQFENRLDTALDDADEGDYDDFPTDLSSLKKLAAQINNDVKKAGIFNSGQLRGQFALRFRA